MKVTIPLTDLSNCIKQKQYMVQWAWADTYILKRHLPMYPEHGCKVIKSRHMSNSEAMCWKYSTSGSGASHSHVGTNQRASPECTKGARKALTCLSQIQSSKCR